MKTNKIFKKNGQSIKSIIILEIMMTGLSHKEDSEYMDISGGSEERIKKAIGKKSVFIGAKRWEVAKDKNIIIVSFINENEKMKEMIFDENFTKHSEVYDNIDVKTMPVAEIKIGNKKNIIFFAMGKKGVEWKRLC